MKGQHINTNPVQKLELPFYIAYCDIQTQLPSGSPNSNNEKYFNKYVGFKFTNLLAKSQRFYYKYNYNRNMDNF